jgi:hypothetical protein
MTAPVVIRRWVGPSTGPILEDVTDGNTRHITADIHVASGTEYPIPAGNNGYWVTNRLFSGEAPAGSITNVLMFTSGTPAIPPDVAVVGQAASAYVQATGTPGVSGDELTTTNHTALLSAPSSIYGWTVDAPLSLPGSLVNPASGDIASFFVYQVQLPSTIPGGDSNQDTIMYQWDET